MHDPELDALAKESRRQRLLPPGAVCETCHAMRHLKAYPDGRVLCYGCRRTEAGASAVEEDHVAGRANLGGLVVRLRPNDHRTVTEMRTQLGIDEWPAANGDPLLVLAFLLAGLGTLLIVVAFWLVALSAHAQERLGPDGWAGAPLTPVVP